MLLNCIYLILVGVIWGSTIPLTKIAVSAGHHPLGLIFWQVLFSAVALGLWLRFKKVPIQITGPFIRYFLVIAFIGTLLPNSFSLIAASHLPAGIMAVTIATVPLFSLSVALLARIESFSISRCAGILLGVSALCLIALPEASLPDPAMAPWVLVALIAPLCYAIEGNYVAARGPATMSPLVALFGASCCGVVLLLPVVWLSGIGVSVTGRWDASLWAMLGSAMGHVVAYSGYLWLLRRAGAVFTSQIAYVVTLAGIIGAVIFLGERYGYSVWMAVSLMLLGVTLVKPRSADDIAVKPTPDGPSA